MSKIIKLKHKLPTPSEVGVVVPMHVDMNLYNEGFQHGLVSNKLLKREHLKASFREGFRAAKLYIRQQYQNKNINVLPLKARLKFTVGE